MDELINQLNRLTQARRNGLPTSENLLESAKIYILLGYPEYALNILTEIVPPLSADVIALAKLMVQFVQAAKNTLVNNPAESIASLDEAKALLGQNVKEPREWQLLRAEAYLKMGKSFLSNITSIAESLLLEIDSDPEAIVLRGQVYKIQGNNEKAIQYFREALFCSYNYYKAKNCLQDALLEIGREGDSNYKCGNWQNALDKYNKILEFNLFDNDTRHATLMSCALCHIQTGDYNGAIRNCNDALSIDISKSEARKIKAKALYRLRDWNGAVLELRVLQGLSPQDFEIKKDLEKAEIELSKIAYELLEEIGKSCYYILRRPD